LIIGIAPARTHLHLDGVALKNASDDEGTAAELEKTSGRTQAPCLIEDGKALLESDTIIALFVEAIAPIV